jgi:glycolate oxidase FAD binding subunit
MPDSITIDGFGPVAVVRPVTVAEAGALVRKAVAEKTGLYPVGGRTALGIGLPPAMPGLALDTRGLNQLIDYPFADMTVTARAGMNVATLQALLAKQNQWLPVDLAMPREATLGGAVAVNASGPRRLGHGTLRDYLIGISFLTDGGVEVKGGGRVVKNVAGYDLMKLQLGALGTLGVVTQVTFKVKPMPEERVIVTFGLSADRIASTLDAIHATNARPVAVELFNAAAAKAVGLPGNAAWTLAVGFEEKAVTVKWQIETLLNDLSVKATVHRGDDVTRLYAAFTDLPCRPESRYVWKASLRPSQVAAVATTVSGTLVHAHAMNGIVWVHDNDGREPSADGTLVCRTSPAEWKTKERVWGQPASDSALKDHVTKTLDPNGVFNSGRVS